jgi:hypothetical protein
MRIASISLAALLLLRRDEAAAFSSSCWTVKKSTAHQHAEVSRVPPLFYKQLNPEEEPEKAILYNDFEIRESDANNSANANTAKQPSAVEPSSKPSKKFISPIQMMKSIPKVEPITKSSIFFVAPVIEETDTRSSTVSPTSTSNVKPNGMKEKWSPRSKFGTTAFQSTNYLESLSAPSNTEELTPEEEDTKFLMASLKQQQGVIRQTKLQETQEAFRSATRRTNPQEAIMNRIAKGEAMRKKKELEQLEKLAEEKRQKLDEKKRLEKEKGRSMDRYQMERMRIEDVLAKKEMERLDNGAAPNEPIKQESRKRGIPILGPFLKSSMKVPLLVGSTISLPYETLTPFQIKTLEVAQSLHEEHCSKMVEDSDTAGKEGGIEAAPIVAIIDAYTDSVDMPKVKGKRFATLAAVDLVHNSGEPVAVNLMGVGRVFLHSYFSSKDAGLTKDEEELNMLLQKIQHLNDDEVDIKSEEDDHEDDDHPIIMAEFDLFLDDSTLRPKTSNSDVSNHRASSMHGVTELYRCANKVYRLHEERKRLLSGLRTGQARLNMNQSENEVIEYDDWNNVEICSSDEECILELEDYGFGTYGVFSTIPDLTIELMGRLETYYSPAHREREEYEAEVASFVVLRVLDKYATPSELALAMLAPSATERLDLAYEIMARHREELLVLVEKMSTALRECGEECTDLW